MVGAGTTLWTLAAFWTFPALSTLWTGTAFALYIALGLLEQDAAAQLELAGLGVNLQELHLQLVALLDASLFDGLKALPVDFADMEQSVLARHELYEAAVRHDAANGTFIDFANLGYSHDSLNLSQSSIDALLVGTADLNLAYAILFVDGNGGTVSSCIPWIIFPPGPMTAPMNSFGIIICSMRGT